MVSITIYSSTVDPMGQANGFCKPTYTANQPSQCLRSRAARCAQKPPWYRPEAKCQGPPKKCNLEVMEVHLPLNGQKVDL